MTATVTLRWEDDEDAARFLAYRQEFRTAGYLSDADGDILQGLVGDSEVVEQ